MGMLDPVPGPSDYIRGALQGLVQEYASNLEWDLDWALDWGADDDLHTRGDSACAAGDH